jgi:hypothetical protein
MFHFPIFDLVERGLNMEKRIRKKLEIKAKARRGARRSGEGSSKRPTSKHQRNTKYQTSKGVILWHVGQVSMERWRIGWADSVGGSPTGTGGSPVLPSEQGGERVFEGIPGKIAYSRLERVEKS